MQRKLGISVALVVLVFIAGLASGYAKTVHAAGSCVYEGFEASVLQGTDKGLSLQGKLELSADDSGKLTGLYSVYGGQPMHVAGQVYGSLIGLIFDARSKEDDPPTFVYGTGTIIGNFSDCHPDIGGTLSGPASDDLGTWSDICRPSRPGIPPGSILCVSPPPPPPNPVPPLDSPFLN